MGISPRIEDHSGHYVTLTDAHVTQIGLLGEVSSEPSTEHSTEGGGQAHIVVYRTTLDGQNVTLTSAARVVSCRDEGEQK